MTNQDTTPTEYFVASLASDVRRMPVADARTFLRGLLILVGDDTRVDPLREIYRHLDLGDAQLELIASGQLKLAITDPATAPPAQDGASQS